MNFAMHRITIGARAEQKLLITTECCITFLGESGPRVLSTPHMIGYLERTCRDLALPLLEPGYDTVGTRVNITHSAAAGIGDVVTFTAEVAGATDRRIEFRVEARNEREKIGEGLHERAIIDVAKFASRLAEKKQKG
jgi:predicted thioesterase